jgi:iron complex outermembrane recepter protein
MNRFTLLLLLILCAFSARSQQNPVLSGKITDQHNTALPGAAVHFLNTHFGATADNDGNFTIASIPAGTYRVQISAVGFATVEKTITIPTTNNESWTVQLAESLTQLDDVIVTAQKKEETLQTIPVSISSLSSRQVQEYRIWNTKDITAIVPNLYSANPGDGRNVTSIRGITSTSYDPSVATYIDGVNQFGLDTYIAQLFDVERIEVLRGPQGTLYGRNAMGGVINIITKQPTNKTDGFVETSFGTYGQQRYSAGVRTALIKDKLFMGVSAIYDHNDGFFTNQFNNSKFDSKHSLTGNYYLKLLASEKWTLTYNLKHNQNRNDGAFPLAYQQDAKDNPFQLNQNAIAHMIDNVFNTSLSASYAGTRFSFTSQTGYQSNYRYYQTPIDGDFSPIDGVSIVNNYGRKYNNVKAVTQEFKFTSPAASVSPFSWTAGTYLYYQNNPVKQGIHYGVDGHFLGAPDSISTINTTKAQSAGLAFFGQSTYEVSEKFYVTAGLRYDYEHKKQTVLGEYQHDPNPDPQPVIVTSPEATSTVSYTAISPKLSAAFHITPSSNLFGSYARGFRTGGFNQLSSNPAQSPSFKPEYSDNFELGSKNSFLENKVRMNLTFFYINVSNAQVPILILPDAITTTTNAGKLSSKGMELEVSTTPAKGLQLDYNLGLNDARYKTFDHPAEQTSSPSGKRQIFTSPVTSMLALQYSLDFHKASQLRLVGRGEWMYLGKKYFNFDAANEVSQAAYGMLNARFGLTAKRFEVMFWARNLGNKKYIDYAYDFGAVHLGNPRNYGVTVRVNF